MFLVQQDISKINWALMNKATNENTDNYRAVLAYLGIPKGATWVLPQLMAFCATLPIKRNDTGKFSFRETISTIGGRCDAGEIKFQSGNLVTKEIISGIFRFLRNSPRGGILPAGYTQSSKTYSRWATGVPLLLSAFKEFREVGYDEWDWSEDPKFIVPIVGSEFEKLLPYILAKEAFPWTTEELLALTDAAAIYKSGAKVGQKRTLNQLTSFTRTGLDEGFDSLEGPSWLRPMICQTWCFQPQIISKYAINNFISLDTHVPPLRGDVDLFIKENSTSVSSQEDMPW